jgi:hypothetical protein
MAVPNVKSIWRGIFGLNWVSGWFAPFHLFHYTSESLSFLAGRHGFKVIESWSNTPESWFRLNLKSILLPSENMLDTSKHWLDNRFIKCFLIIILRIIEITVKERDCLVVKLQKI